MTNSTSGNNRDGVLEKLIQADTEDAKIEEKARDLLITMTHQRDLNRAFSETVKTIPSDSIVPNELWRGLQWALDNRIAQAQAVNIQLNTLPQYSTMLYGSTAIASVMVSSLTVNQSSVPAQPSVPDWYNDRFAPSVTQLNQVMQQGQAREHIEQLLKNLQLDKDKGDIKSPLMHLQEAYLALNQANTELASATSIFIPLRGCIEAIVSMLLPRRREQEKTGGLRKQIESIGRQCKNDHVQDALFPSLGMNAAVLYDLYSGFKDKRILREEVLVHFNAGVALIRSLLHSIDPSKLK